MPLTGVEDIDIYILAFLDLTALDKACQSCRYIHKLYYRDLLWYIKVKHEFGEKIANLKRCDISYYEQYRYLRNAKSFFTVI